MPDVQLPKLLFGDHVGKTFSNADDFYQFVSKSNPAVIRAYRPRSEFAFKGSIVNFPQLKISTSTTDPCEITTEFVSKQFSLVVPLHGYGNVLSRGVTTDWNPKNNVIINPFKERQLFTFKDVRSQVLFELDAQRLVETVVAMYGIEPSSSVLSAHYTSVEQLTDADQHIVSILLSTLSLIDITGADEEHLTRIGFDDVIIRLIGELAFIKGGRDAAADVSHAKRSTRALDLICYHIRQANSSPMTVTEMSKLSGMTGRALAYAFNEKFGCTPQQWQRNHYLDEARKELLRIGNTSSVKQIAYQFCFSSPTSFAKFYSKRFGEQPSRTLANRHLVSMSIRKD